MTQIFGGLPHVETLEIARDVVKTLTEAQNERPVTIQLRAINDIFDYPLILGA